jgi:hypothetical protein
MRKAPLQGFINLNGNPPKSEWGGFLALDVVHPVHETVGLPAESLESAWKAIHGYVSSACRLIRSRKPGWLDGEEAEQILDKLGSPPQLCYPVYVLAVFKGSEKRVVYVGKTSTDQGRFRGGHAALTKLHHPMYDGFAKRIYLGAVVLLGTDGEYQPLEWVKPLLTAKQILSSIEAQLIFDLKPELNTVHKNRYNVTWPVQLHVQNFADDSKFLHDYMCYP